MSSAHQLLTLAKGHDHTMGSKVTYKYIVSIQFPSQLSEGFSSNMSQKVHHNEIMCRAVWVIDLRSRSQQGVKGHIAVFCVCSAIYIHLSLHCLLQSYPWHNVSMGLQNICFSIKNIHLVFIQISPKLWMNTSKIQNITTITLHCWLGLMQFSTIFQLYTGSLVSRGGGGYQY